MFHSDDVEHVANYQSLSIMALLSLLVGLASPLCIVSRVFLLLPLLGVILSLIALRRIATSEGQLAGRWAAMAGLALCVASGAAAVTRTTTIQAVRTSEAEKFGNGWLELVTAGKTEEAFKVCYDGVRPLPPPEPGMPPRTTTPYEEFLGSALIKEIIDAGPDSVVELVATLQYDGRSPESFVVQQQFRISPPSESMDSTKPFGITLTMQHARMAGAAKARWLVMKYEHSDLPQ